MNVYAIVLYAFVSGTAAYVVYLRYREHRRLLREAAMRRHPSNLASLDSIEARLIRVREELAAMESELLGDNALWDAAIDFEVAARRRAS